MKLKDKLFLIAGNVDDSIKSQTAVYDVTIFKTFVDFEKYVDKIPIVIDTLVLTTNELQFTNTNMARVLNILSSPFVQITGAVIYLIDYSYNLDEVNKFLTSKGIMSWSVQQGDLSLKFITDIVSGERREAVEGQIDLVTYRIRADEYIKQKQISDYQNLDGKYQTDEDELSGIPDIEAPELISPSIEGSVITDYIVGADQLERTWLAFIIAQYRALKGKTLLIEKDVEYHRLTDMFMKSGLDAEFFTMEEVFADLTKVIRDIREASINLVVIGAVKRMSYDYTFIADTLQDNLQDALSYVIRECSFEETPYGVPYIIVMRNNVPDVLQCINSLRYGINPKEVNFIGVQLSDLGQVEITEKEMSSIIEVLLEKNGLFVQTIKAEGIILKGDDVTYDILSVLSRNNGG